jgi:hypothetical protein
VLEYTYFFQYTRAFSKFWEFSRSLLWHVNAK